MASRAGTARARQRQAEDRGLGGTIIVDGVQHSVFSNDLSALDTQALRRELGLSFVGLMRALATDPDIDLFAGLVWLSRRTQGEVALSYSEVAKDFTYDTKFEVVPQDSDDPEDALPET